jgi:FkbM family methyltransferase
LDIGANFGVLTLLMSKLVGPQGLVHAFEPNPILCKFMETTFAHNCLTNVRLHAVALGAYAGKMELHVPSENFGGASLVGKTIWTKESFSVPVQRLDDVISREENRSIALIKIDVEGFELEVLKGAQRILDEFRPTVIFESNENLREERITPVMKLLRDIGYRFIMIPRRFVRMKTRLIDLDHPNQTTGHDLVGAPKGKQFIAVCESLRTE